MPSVLLVILNWNGIDDTEACLASLLSQHYDPFSVLVVDNGSRDDSVARLRTLAAAHDNITLIENPRNLGFAGGVNVGIRHAINHGFDSVALFNNDAVAEPNWLASLVNAQTAAGTAITTGLLLHQDGTTIDSTGDYYSLWGMPFPRSRNEPRESAPMAGPVFGASGGATLYKTSLFTSIGLFDEVFFAYYEDVDISFRAQLAGFTASYTDAAVAYHKQGATSQKIPGFAVYQTFKNIPLLFVKNVPARLLFPIGTRLLLVYVLIFGNALKNGRGISALKGWLASVWYTATRALGQRRLIQAQKVVSTAYIRSIIHPELPPDQTGVRRFVARFTRRA